MKLEILSRLPATPNAWPPLLLVHGAWHAAWCWEDTFLRYLPELGWEVHALSLRGHGASEGRERLRWWSVADYVADVEQAVATLRRAPILVGHSMGGFVVQKYLERHEARGAVLLASAPPDGIRRFFLRILRRHPLAWLEANLRMRTYPVVKKPEFAREWFLSPGIAEDELAAYHARLQDESFRASLDMLMLDLVRPRRTRTPVAVLGAAEDPVFKADDIERSARAYGVQARIFPGMSHAMNVEPGWRQVAEWISNWSAEQAAKAA